jgi:hypothetical protein
VADALEESPEIGSSASAQAVRTFSSLPPFYRKIRPNSRSTRHIERDHGTTVRASRRFWDSLNFHERIDQSATKVQGGVSGRLEQTNSRPIASELHTITYDGPTYVSLAPVELHFS